VIFFDGEATRWIPELEADADLLPHDLYADVRERGLVGGACGFCALFSKSIERSRRSRSPSTAAVPNTARTLPS